MVKGGYNSSNQWLDGSKKIYCKRWLSAVRGQFEKVQWHNWVWAAYNVPKHSFVAWKVALGRLRTKERLMLAGVCSNDDCILCVDGKDACLHLFFRCQSSRRICGEICIGLELESIRMNASIQHGGNGEGNIEATILYFVRKARNQALWHENVHRPETVMKEIKNVVCIKVRSKVTVKWSNEEMLWLNRLLESSN